MRESSTYQAILAEGRAEGVAEGRTEGQVLEARRVLRLLGDPAFGAPDAETAARIEQTEDLARLEEWLGRVRTAGSWQEVLGPAAPPPRGRRRRSP